MQKFFYSILLTGSFFFLSCNSNKSAEDEGSADDISNAGKQYCDCISKQTNKVSSKLKKAIIKASKEDDPETALKEELEKNDLAEEFKEAIDTDEADNCAKKAAKKYELDVDDKSVQKKVLAKIEDEEDCELPAAFLRIGLKKKQANKPVDDDTKVNDNNTGDEGAKAANDLCDCLSAKFPEPSEELKAIMKTVAESDDPIKAFKMEIMKLGDQDTKLRDELNKLIQIDDAAMLECSGKIKDYKVAGTDPESKAKKVLAIMLSKPGCEVPAGEWAVGVQKEYKRQ